MNKAAQKRLIDAIDHDDLEAARTALDQGAEPGLAIDRLAVPAFWLMLHQREMTHAGAILDLFLERGLDPNLRYEGGYARPLRVGLGTPLLCSLLRADRSVPPPGTLSQGDAMVQRLLEAGADPLAEETSEDRRNAWSMAAYNHRWQVLEMLDRFVPRAWVPPDDRDHPLLWAFDRDAPSGVQAAIADRLLQRFPDAFDHAFKGVPLVVRMQQTGKPHGVAWAVLRGVTPTVVLPLEARAYFDPDRRPVLPANRFCSVWPSVVRVAMDEGVDHPFVRWALTTPSMRAVINEPVWLRDLQVEANEDGRITPLSYALHAEAVMPRYGEDAQHRWKAVVEALVNAGALPDHRIDPEAPTPGQRWARGNVRNAGEMLDLYPAWEAPHPVSGRTPLFDARTRDDVLYWVERGQRLDQEDAQGEQAFTTLVARAVTGDDTTLAAWCAQRLTHAEAPFAGMAGGRSLGDWVGARGDLLKAYTQGQTPDGATEVMGVGDQALHAAAEKLNLAVLKKLLADPAKAPDVNVRDAQGLTPLMRLMLARVTTLKQVIRRNEAIEVLVQAGARGDAVGTVTFDVTPKLAKPARSNQPAEPGHLVTTTGSALHLLATRTIDGEESMGPLQRYRAVKLLMATPGACDPHAWSTSCSDLVARVVLDAPEDQASPDPTRVKLPPLSRTWEMLGLDRLDPVIVNDLLMAMLDPRRVLSHEGGGGAEYARSLTGRFNGTMFDVRVQRLVRLGAGPFSEALNGRTPLDAMTEWAAGAHAATRPSRYNLAPLKPVDVHQLYQAHLLDGWKRWVDMAHETRALQQVWVDAHEGQPDTMARTRRRL